MHPPYTFIEIKITKEHFDERVFSFALVRFCNFSLLIPFPGLIIKITHSGQYDQECVLKSIRYALLTERFRISIDKPVTSNALKYSSLGRETSSKFTYR